MSNALCTLANIDLTYMLGLTCLLHLHILQLYYLLLYCNMALTCKAYIVHVVIRVRPYTLLLKVLYMNIT
mgnify:CR=1 FL=1